MVADIVGSFNDFFAFLFCFPLFAYFNDVKIFNLEAVVLFYFSKYLLVSAL